MTLPLDVFDRKLRDAHAVLRMIQGEGESPQEKFDRMARERMGGGKSLWWD